MNVERRAVVLGQADKVEDLGVLSEVVNAVADSSSVEAGKRDVLGGVSGNTNAGTGDGRCDLVERSANVGPVGQVLQAQVDDGVRDDGNERGRQAVACDARIGAVLNNAVGNEEVVENALAYGADSFWAGKLEKASEGHSLELMTLVSKDVGDAAKCELHRVSESDQWQLVNSATARFSN